MDLATFKKLNSTLPPTEIQPDGKVVTGLVRLNYVYLDSDREGYARNSLKALMPNARAFAKAMIEVFKPQNPADFLTDALEKPFYPLKEMKPPKRLLHWPVSEIPSEDGESLLGECYVEGASGSFNAKSNFDVRVVGSKRETLPLTAAKSGYWARLIIKMSRYSGKGNTGYAFYLSGIQLLRKDEVLSGGGVAFDEGASDIEADDFTREEDDFASKPVTKSSSKSDSLEDDDEIPF